MTKRVTGILNRMNLEEIDSLKIDNEEHTIKLGFIDASMSYHEVELLGVDNYHFLDENMYEESSKKDASNPIKFFDTMMSLYLSVTIDDDGNILDKSFVEPNFVMNSKNKSMSARADIVKIDGVYYEIKNQKTKLH